MKNMNLWIGIVLLVLLIAAYLYHQDKQHTHEKELQTRQHNHEVNLKKTTLASDFIKTILQKLAPYITLIPV